MRYLRSLLLTLIFTTNAYCITPVLSETEATALAEQCRQLSLQLYQISTHQSRFICQANLDGLNVYYASNYIMQNWLVKAQEVLYSSIVQVKYALDIGCDDSAYIAAVIKGLKSVNSTLNGVNGLPENS